MEKIEIDPGQGRNCSLLCSLDLAVEAKRLLVQCVPSALPPRDEVADCNADNSQPVKDQEHVEPNHFRPVRLNGVVRHAKPSDNSVRTSYCILGLYHLTQQ